MEKEYFEEYRKLLPAAEKYTYMNSAGCGPMSIPVQKKMESVFRHMTEEGQVNVEIHQWLKTLLEAARKDVADFIHADYEEVFFVRCVAEGLNTIARMFSWEKGDSVLISDQENPASILPFFIIEPIYQIKTEIFSGIGEKPDIIGQFCTKINDNTKMTVISHVFHTTGTVIPAREICREARKKNIISVLDGAQAAGNTKIDVKELGCDFYILSCHKWLCGPEGVAAVYIKKELIDNVITPFGGVGMQESFDFENHAIAFKSDARRFEYGGRHIPMYVAFSEAIKLANKIGFDQILNRMRVLHQYCRSQFGELIPNAVIISPRDEHLRTGIFAFFIPGVNHRELVKKVWEERRIIIQWRIRDLITEEESVRISLNWFNTEGEIDLLVTTIRGMVGK